VWLSLAARREALDVSSPDSLDVDSSSLAQIDDDDPSLLAAISSDDDVVWSLRFCLGWSAAVLAAAAAFRLDDETLTSERLAALVSSLFRLRANDKLSVAQPSFNPFTDSGNTSV